MISAAHDYITLPKNSGLKNYVLAVPQNVSEGMRSSMIV